MSRTPSEIIADTVSILDRVRARRPRVQCLTNTVAQQISANVLLAVGARVSMATHTDEVVAMTASADALLINLGTPDAARIAAIPLLLASPKVMALPRVLDPVFVEHSPLRLALARKIMAAGPVIVKGNAAEIKALAPSPDATCVATGITDHIRGAGGIAIAVGGGDPFMGMVTGLGCALGALIAACAAVEADAVRASTAAVLLFAAAGEASGAKAKVKGPGTFVPKFLDALYSLDAATLDFYSYLTIKTGPDIANT